MKRTPAIEILDKAKAKYELHEFEATEFTAEEVSVKLNISLSAVYKTLVVTGEKSKECLAVVPGDKELNLKKLASALTEKRAVLVSLNEIQKLTGYLKGGVSPFGTKKSLPVLIDSLCLKQVIVSVSAGLRGLQVFITPQELIRVSSAKVCDLA